MTLWTTSWHVSCHFPSATIVALRSLGIFFEIARTSGRLAGSHRKGSFELDRVSRAGRTLSYHSQPLHVQQPFLAFISGSGLGIGHFKSAMISAMLRELAAQRCSEDAATRSQSASAIPLATRGTILCRAYAYVFVYQIRGAPRLGFAAADPPRATFFEVQEPIMSWTEEPHVSLRAERNHRLHVLATRHGDGM